MNDKDEIENLFEDYVDKDDESWQIVVINGKYYRKLFRKIKDKVLVAEYVELP